VPRFAIVDSQFLFDILDGDGMCEEVLFEARFRGYTPTITPTTGHELLDMATQDSSATARDALSLISVVPSHSNILFSDLANPVHHGQASLAAQELIDKRLLAEDELNVGLILAEAACLQASVVIFDDDVSSRLDRKEINNVLAGRDLATLIIMTRSQFLAAGRR
jgi:hypothetical protein